MNRPWEVFEEFGELPDPVRIQWIAASIIIYKNTYSYFAFLTKPVGLYCVTWRLILDQPKEDVIKANKSIGKRSYNAFLNKYFRIWRIN